MPASGGEPVKVVDGVFNSLFVVLERGIYYAEEEAGRVRLRYFDLAARRSAMIAGGLGAVTMFEGLSATADGRSILYARQDSAVDDLMLVENFR